MNIIVTILLWTTYIIGLYFVVFWMLVFFSPTQKKKREVLNEFPTVSITVPAYNEEDSIIPTLRSLVNLDYPKGKLEILIINDGSTDKTKELVQRFIKNNKETNIKLINQENSGKGKAMNNALRISKGEYFVCMDADSFIEKNALKKLLPYFTNKDVAVVLPTLKVKNPKNMLQKFQWYEYLVNMFYKYLMGKLDSVLVAPGPFSVYKKEIIQKIGGFDDNNNLTEDLEITLRLQKHNYKLIQTLDTQVTTIAPNNIKALYKQRNRWYKGSIINAFRYKSMILNPQYGDFGMAQMPLFFLSGFVALTLITTLIYYSLKPYVKGLYNLSFVDFDIFTYLRNFSWDYYFLDLNFTNWLIAIVMLIMSLFVIRKAHLFTKEKVTKHGIITPVLFVFLFFIMLGIAWLTVAFDLITRRKQKW